jgi:hypothetical protein
MSRGLDGAPRGDIASARRKRDRRTAAAQAERERRRRRKVTERRHAKGFLRPAVRVAKSVARGLGGKVLVERTGAGGRRAPVRWSVAVVDLAPMDISVRFDLADKRGSGAGSTIRVYAGRKLLRACPEELMRSGSGREFGEWLREGLDAAAKRSASDAG